MKVVLWLNCMRHQSEKLTPVAYADTQEELQAFLDRERVDQYTEIGDGGHGNEMKARYRWIKSFRKDGPLEWYNPPDQWGGKVDPLMDREEYLIQVGQRYDEFFSHRFQKFEKTA